MARKPGIAYITDTHGTKENLGLIWSVFLQLFNYCIENRIYLVVHAGDWFTHRSGQSLAVSLMMKQIIRKFNLAGIRIATISGNHDKPDLDAKESYLDLYTMNDEEVDFLVYREAGSLHYQEANTFLYFIPFFSDKEIYLLELLAVNKMCKANRKTHPDAHHVLVTHIAINGVKNLDGSLVEGDLEADLFSIFCKVIVGHYHERQEIKPNILYMGSAYQANFGETVANKGFEVYNSGDQTYKRIPTEFPTYEKFVIKVDKESEAVEVLKNYERFQEEGGQARIRIIFKGPQQQLDALDLGKYAAAGIDVKKESVEGAVLFSDINEADSVVMDKAGLIKGWREYTKHVGMDKSDELEGLKVLSTVKM